MEKETLLLNKEETLIHTLMGLIGIGLPQHYAIALAKLDKLIKEKGIGNITIDDAVGIKYNAAKEWAHRCEEPNSINW